MSSSTRAAAQRMAENAAALLAALSAEQRTAIQFEFPNDDERLLWFYTPTDHGGLPLSGMTPPQQQRAMRLLSSGLSPAGYTTAAVVMGMEQVIDRDEGFRAPLTRIRQRDPGMYYFSVFGEPSETGAWGWRFGGHHLSIHHTMVNGEVASSTPCFIGMEPATSEMLGGHLLRPFAAVEDLARDLMRSFDDTQRSSAWLSPHAPSDLVLGNRPYAEHGAKPKNIDAIWRETFDGVMAERLETGQQRMNQHLGITPAVLDAVSYTNEPKGVASTAMSAAQVDQVRAVLHAYLDRAPDEVANAEWAKVDADITQLHFAWAGGLEPGQAHYYRIQGPRLIAEYDNAQNNVNHAHSVWRDPRNDFARDTLARHYAHDH